MPHSSALPAARDWGRNVGRSPNPIPEPDSAVGRLAQKLRGGLMDRSFSYQELAAQIAYHATTLQRAADGKTVASWAVVSEFARACDLDKEDVRLLWQAARSERDGRPTPRPRPPVAVEQIATYADLGLYLVWVREKAGSPSYQRMEDRAEATRTQFGRLPHSTAHRIGARKANRPSLKQMRAYLVGCGIPAKRHDPLVRAWRRADARYWGEDARQNVGRRLANQSTALPEPYREASPVQLAHDMGYVPLEAYRGPSRPWSVRCTACGEIRRIRLGVEITNSVPRDDSMRQGCRKCVTQAYCSAR